VYCCTPGCKPRAPIHNTAQETTRVFEIRDL
jgi:hypothetical protein